MCNGGGPPKITITVSATTAVPYPPGLSDGVSSIEPGGENDASFTTEVKPGQTVQFVPGGNVTAIVSITEGDGSDIFSQDPTKANNWTGVIGTKLAKDDTREYTICYQVSGHNDTYCQDPRLRMNR